MKIRFTAFAGALAAAAVLAAPVRAVQSADAVSAGDRLRRIVSIDTETLLPGGGTLLKSAPADVEIESLGKGKVRATFFQGGARKGEAEGIILLGGAPAVPGPKGPAAGPGGRPGPGPLRLSDLGFDANTPYVFSRGAGKVELVIGNPGANQILIGLLLPAVQAPQVVAPQKPAAVPPPDADRKARDRDVQGK